MASQPWNEPLHPDRVAPRECINAARIDLTYAWCQSNSTQAIRHILSACDWIRRALEQMEEAHHRGGEH